MKGAAFQRDAKPLHAIGELTLKPNGLGFTGCGADPQDIRRAARREHADAAERQVERRLRHRLTDRFDDWRNARLRHFAEEDERQVHLFRANPLDGGASGDDRGFEAPLLFRDRRARGIVQIDGDEQAQGG
jgi:hypothetical protein